MKKGVIFLLAGLTIMSLTAMARANLDGVTVDYGQGTFTFNTDYVLKDFAVRVSAKNNNVLNLNNLVEIGYYKIENGRAGTPVSIPIGSENSTASDSPTFKAGDTIGIYVKLNGHLKQHGNQYEWISDGETYTYTSTQGAIDDAEGVVKYNAVDAEEDPQYFSLFIDNNAQHQPHYQYAFDGEPSNGGGNPSGGQPLPGLLMSLAIGGTALASMARKRKKDNPKA